MREENIFNIYKTLSERLRLRGIDSETFSQVTTLYRIASSERESNEMNQEAKHAQTQAIVDELMSVKDFEGNPITGINYLQGIRVLKEKIRDLEYELDMSKMFEENAVISAMDRYDEDNNHE